MAPIVEPQKPLQPLQRVDDFEIYSAPSLVRFLSRGVQPPSYVYLKHTDVLQVGCASSQAGESVTFSYRLLRADGSLIKGQFILQVPSTRAVVTQQEPMAEGFLLSLSCKAAVATTRGQTFARVFLTSGSLGPGQPSYMLMADYVTTAMAPAHPNGRVLAPTEGPGFVYTPITSIPPVGTNQSTTAPLNVRWKIKSILQVLTIANAGTPRTVFCGAGAFAAQSFSGAAYATAAINSTVTFCASGVVGNSTILPGLIGVPLPYDLILPPNGFIELQASNINAADQWGNPVILVEEWLDNV